MMIQLIWWYNESLPGLQIDLSEVKDGAEGISRRASNASGRDEEGNFFVTLIGWHFQNSGIANRESGDVQLTAVTVSMEGRF